MPKLHECSRNVQDICLSRGVLRYDDTGRVGQQISSSQRSQRLKTDMIDSSKDTKDSADISKDGTEICHVVTKRFKTKLKNMKIYG